MKLNLFIVSLLVLYICNIGFAKPVLKGGEQMEYVMVPIPKQVDYESFNINKPISQLERVVKIDPVSVPHQQGYELEITQGKVIIKAHDKAGVFYAEQTLVQISSQTGQEGLKCLTIKDWPDFPVRGVMLDISRDKVPTMDTLFSLVRLLASWKINHFQLYMEHTFAYKNHEVVWKDASPMTADQIKILDAYCKEYFIDLVPNQNSFGHMNRWLKHEKYSHLAEAPALVDTVWGMMKCNSLYPAEPGSIELVSELYDELLPNFSSKYFNVGLDETVELGNGRSKQLCEEVGTEKVYFDYLLKIYNQVQKHDKLMMFWADMIQEHPEVIGELPENIIALLWGYEANHPFDKYCKTVSDSGREFYVCPGNSTWVSIAGQTKNATGNLLNAAENGLEYGASGYVITDWADRGGWEPITLSYLGYAYGAALSWSVETNRDIDLPAVLSQFAFNDKANIMGQLVYNIGKVYEVSGVVIHNATFYGKLLMYLDWNLDSEPMNQLTVEKIIASKQYLNKIIRDIDTADMERDDAQYIVDEIRHSADLIAHACDLGIARFKTDGKKTEDIDADTRRELAVDIKRLIENHRKLWLRRNRIGGLQESVSRLEDQLKLYEKYMY